MGSSAQNSRRPLLGQIMHAILFVEPWVSSVAFSPREALVGEAAPDFPILMSGISMPDGKKSSTKALLLVINPKTDMVPFRPGCSESLLKE